MYDNNVQILKNSQGQCASMKNCSMGQICETYQCISNWPLLI